MKGVDKYSKRIAKRLFQKYPDWESLACVEKLFGENYLRVDVPAPFHNRERDLIFMTMDERITIYFDYYHVHFYDWSSIDGFEAAMEYLHKLFSEEIVIVMKVVDGKPTNGMCVKAQHLSSLSVDTITYTRSWLGTYNQQFA